MSCLCIGGTWDGKVAGAAHGQYMLKAYCWPTAQEMWSPGFEFEETVEIHEYFPESIEIGDKAFNFWRFRGITKQQAIEKLINGYAKLHAIESDERYQSWREHVQQMDRERRGSPKIP